MNPLDNISTPKVETTQEVGKKSFSQAVSDTLVSTRKLALPLMAAVSISMAQEPVQTSLTPEQEAKVDYIIVNRTDLVWAARAFINIRWVTNFNLVSDYITKSDWDIAMAEIIESNKLLAEEKQLIAESARSKQWADAWEMLANIR